MKHINLEKYDLTDPNITGAVLCRIEGCNRDTLYKHLKKAGIKLRGRGQSDLAKSSMFGRKSRKRQSDPFMFYVNRFYKQWRNGASGRGIEFIITLDDVLHLWKKQKGLCALSGEPMDIGGFQYDVSLDRINSVGDYTSNNVQLVLKRVNYMKQSIDEEEFIRLCLLIGAHRGK